MEIKEFEDKAGQTLFAYDDGALLSRVCESKSKNKEIFYWHNIAKDLDTDFTHVMAINRAYKEKLEHEYLETKWKEEGEDYGLS